MHVSYSSPSGKARMERGRTGKHENMSDCSQEHSPGNQRTFIIEIIIVSFGGIGEKLSPVDEDFSLTFTKGFKDPRIQGFK